MPFDFTSLKKRSEEIAGWLSGELAAIRSGRANPGLLEKISVDSYGAKTPIAHVASIAVLDARTLKIGPWDKSLIPAVQSAIDKENLGVSTAPDEDGVRVSFPELTAEKRSMLTKLVRERLEEARVSLRRERDEAWNAIQRMEKDKEVTEDDKFRLKDELQNIIDEWMKKTEAAAQKKEKEITEV